MAIRDRWCQLRMSEEELASLDRLVERIRRPGGVSNRADAIRALVHAEHVRLDRSEARSKKNPD